MLNVVTYLDMVEHIDVEDVSTLVLIFRWYARFLLSSPHALLLHISTWKRLFELTGFDIIVEHFCPNRRTVDWLLPLVVKAFRSVVGASF